MGHEEDPEKQEDSNLGLNVVSIKPPPRFGVFGSLLIQIGMGALILGIGVFAVYYSIDTHSDDKKDTKELAKTVFSLNRTQYCLKNGIYTREFNNGNDHNGNHNHTTEKFETVWVQDHDAKKLFYTVGKPNEKDTIGYYIYSHFTLTVQNNKCVKSNFSYDEFLAKFGISGVPYIRTEEVQQNSGSVYETAEEEKFIEVNFFQGETIFSEEAEKNTTLPVLGFGYMDLSNSVSYAWQLYYQDLPENPIYFEEYWYPEMTSGLADVSYYTIPDICLPQIT